MARLQQSGSLKPLLCSFLIVALSTLSSARVLNDHLPHKKAAREPVLSIALPGGSIVERSSANAWEKDSKNVFPGDMEKSDVTVPARVSWKYGPMFLNMLPKGSVPSSGPSRGYNGKND